MSNGYPSSGAPTITGPRILAVLPRAGVVGDVVQVYGERLDGVSAVRLGTLACVFTVTSAGQLAVTIPAGATANPLGVRAGASWTYSEDVLAVYDPTTLTYDARATLLDGRWRRSIAASGQVGVKLFDYATDGVKYLALFTPRSGNEGNLGIEFPWARSGDWSIRFTWLPGCILGGYLLSTADVQGQTALRIDNNSGAPRLVTCLRGAPGTFGAGGETWATAVAMPSLRPGDECEIRWAYDAALFTGDGGRGGTGYESAVWVFVNGVLFNKYVQNSNQVGEDLTPTAVYLGSNMGMATGAFPVPITHLIAQGRPHAEPHCEFALFGDSTSADFGDGTNNTATMIYGPSEYWTRPGIRSYAASGTKVADMATLWSTSPHRGQSYLRAVMIMIGSNNFANDESSASVIAALNTWTADIRSSTPGCKIIMAQNPPAVGWLSGGQVTAHDEVNAAILAGTVTNVDAVVAESFSKINDGTGRGWSWMETSDSIHINNFGRDIVAGAYRRALVSTGAWV